MKAEDYIKQMLSLYDGELCEEQIRHIIYMVRLEEREKAIDAINGTIIYIKSEIENGRSISENSVLSVFKELLNKEN